MLKPSLPSKQLSRYTTQSFIFPLIFLLAIIVIYETVHLINFPDSFIEFTLGFVLLFLIIYTAFRHGLWPAVMSALLSTIYLVFALSGPGRHIVPFNEIIGGLWVIVLLFCLPALSIGYLSDRVTYLIQRERTARMDAEEGRLLLEKVLEVMPVGVVIAKAPTGKVLFSNRHLDQLLGHPVPNHESLESYPKHTIVNDEGEPLPEHMWPLYRVLKNEETIVNEEFSYQVNPHTRLKLQVKGAPIFNNDNKLTSGVVVIEDVTADKELIQRKDDFLSLISHELKTPVTSLKVYAQLLIKQVAANPDHDPTHELRQIDKQVDKMNTIINSMMDLATLQIKDNSLDKKSLVALSAVIDDVMQDIANSHPQRKIILKQRCISSIYGDYSKLMQVFSNLISNAIKYSPEETPIIINSSTHESYVLINIQDFGIGISARDKQRIFNRFYQEPQRNGKIYPGLGLGLYFSSEIVKQHNGKIWVESKKGEGSTFFISFPLADDH